MIPHEFIKQVKGVLSHLYDAAHLQNHPLGELLVGDSSQGAVSKGQALRRVVLEAIEALQPANHVQYSSKEWRPYRVLFGHYVQRVPVPLILEDLAISDRQYQREHARAVRAVASLLWNQCQQAAAAESAQDRNAVTGQVAASELEDISEVDRFVAGAAAGSGREALSGDRLIRGAVRAVANLAASRGVTIVLQVGVGLPPLYGDRGILRQIVLNILSYLLAEPQAAKLYIAVRCDERAACLTFTWEQVTEAAPIPCEEIVTADPPDAASSARLAVARQLCEAVEGSLCVQKDAVHLRLPLHRTVLLVVDDNEDLIHLFERYLADSPVQVIGARNAEQAMELARKVSPSLITLDVMMPTHDGWEILQNLKHHPETRAIPVAVCSILEEPHLAVSLGADDYIKKPVTQKALLDLIARWERSRLAEEQ